ncbi:MAG: hypothetical protein HYS89_00820 [Candidatus Colwellbacteria bacterium]|nr:hypothetical protein [Candidatus Colwellbacteria bacterium]
MSRIRNLIKKPYVQIALLVFLISLLSFGIGYLIGRDWQQTPIIIENNITP